MKPKWALANGATGSISLFDGGSEHALRGMPPLKLDVSAKPARVGAARVGIIFNRRAHANLKGAPAPTPSGAEVDWASPRTPAELSSVLARFAKRGIGVLVIDGGDGTIRDVLSMARAHFRGRFPDVAIVPSGKTNALAIDLQIPDTWSLADALAAIDRGRFEQRAPLEIRRREQEEPELRGFLFGAGAFVRATALAQRAHRLGAFHGVAVGMSLAGALLQTAFGRRDNVWRRGDSMRVELADGQRAEQPFYMLLSTTLQRLPLGLKPFGRVRSGLKILGVNAPPRRMVTAVPALLAGSESPTLEALGYHRRDTEHFKISLDTEFILDGETYSGGDLVIARGVPINFLVP